MYHLFLRTQFEQRMNSTNESILTCCVLNECIAENLGINEEIFYFIYAYLHYPIIVTILVISAAGAFFNIACFISLKECTCEFNQFLTIFTFNSFVLNFNDLLRYSLMLVPNINNLGFEFFIFTVYQPIHSICFTFGGFLDILIIFERLQLFIKRPKLFAKLSAQMWSLIGLILSMIFIGPLLLSKWPIKTLARVGNSSEVIELYKTEFNDFDANFFYIVAYYFSLFCRDVAPLTFEISLNLFLYIQLKNYLKKKAKLLAKNRNINQAIIKNFRKCDENNTRLAIILCFLSAITHILSIMDFISIQWLDYVYSLFTTSTFDLVVALKHTINIFIFYKFNKVFKLYFRKTLLAIKEPMTEIDKLF